MIWIWHAGRDCNKAVSLRATLLVAVVSLLAAVQVGAATGAYFQNTGSQLIVGNPAIELTFSTGNGSLLNLVDKVTGRDLISRKVGNYNGFTFTFTTPTNSTPVFAGGYLGRAQVTTATVPNGVQVTMTFGQLNVNGTQLNLTATLVITVDDSSPLTSWQISLHNPDQITIEQISLPSIAGIGPLSADPANDYLAVPSLSGILYQDPAHNFRLNGGSGGKNYPSGDTNMQFLAYYSKESGAGLYLASQDNAGYTKLLDVGKTTGTDWMILNHSYVPPFRLATDVAVPYTVKLGVFHGDWYDAAVLYRDWALKQPWAQNGPLATNTTAPDWLKKTGMMSYKDGIQGAGGGNSWATIAQAAAIWQQQIQSPPVMNWIGWENHGPWQSIPDFLPPWQDWAAFDATVSATHAAGGRLMMEPSTGYATVGAPSWGALQTAASRGRDGLMYQFQNGVDTDVQMDPAKPWHDALLVFTSQLAQHGIDLVHMDGNPYNYGLCFATDHAHPAGGGNWWFQGLAQIYADVRSAGRAVNPNFAMGGEWYAEPFLNLVESGQDQTNLLDPTIIGGGGVIDSSKVSYIPLWQAVYHDYTLTYSMLAEITGRDAPYYRRGFGIPLVYGEIPMILADAGAPYTLNGFDSTFVQYVKRIATLRTTSGYPFLVEGRMLRPPVPQVPSYYIPPATRIPYTLENTPGFSAPSVLSSAWQSRQRDSAIIFTNISDKKVSFSWTLNAADLSLVPDQPHDLYIVKNGICTSERDGVSLPYTLALDTESTDVFMVVTSNVSGAGAPLFAGCNASLPFAISNSAGASLTSSGTGRSVSVGYGEILPDSGSPTPSGIAIFGFRQNNVLISEVGVPATPALTSGRIYAEIGGAVDAGLAIANPNNGAAAISFYFTDASGNPAGSGHTTIAANQQIAQFLDQPPFKVYTTPGFTGTFSFTSSVPVAVVALRGLTNERGDFLMSTLPVIDTTAPAINGVVVVPHFADGGGWTTQVFLVNPTDNPMTGTLQFVNPTGAAVSVTVGGQVNSSFAYSIPKRTSQTFSTAGIASATASGSIRIVPASGGAGPTPLIVFSYRPAGITVSEAGVPVSSGSAFRTYVESSGVSGQVGNIESGIAVANTASASASVTFDLTDLTGAPVSGISPVTITLSAAGQTAKFLSDIFPSLPKAFKGVLRIAASSSAISVVGLRTRINERGDFLITTTPPTNEDIQATSAPMFLPQVADGGGYTTQFILFSGAAGQNSSGNLKFIKQDGTFLNLVLQ